MGELRPTTEIEELARKLAELEGRDVNEAVADALRAALRSKAPSPRAIASAERLRRKFQIVLTDGARKPLAQSVYDELWPNS